MIRWYLFWLYHSFLLLGFLPALASRASVVRCFEDPSIQFLGSIMLYQETKFVTGDLQLVETKTDLSFCEGKPKYINFSAYTIWSVVYK